MTSCKIRKRIVLFLLCVLLILGSAIWLSSNYLIVQKYALCKEIKQSIRIVQLTDLHNKEFGKDNRRLVKKIFEHSPDLIFMTGDMLNADDKNTDIICSLIRQLSKIAPVYYSYGNHEKDWEKVYQGDLQELLSRSGATVLNNSYVDFTIKGEKIRIGGYYGYYRTPHMSTNDPDRISTELAFADEFENTDRLKLLLCHIPTSWVDWHYIDSYSVDIVFCGHYHGGQIRIPFIGGLYAPYVGWLPKNTQGLFIGKYAACVLSAGLGTESWLPRINNYPEIIVIDLQTE